jgi:hypothetical protein
LIVDDRCWWLLLLRRDNYGLGRGLSGLWCLLLKFKICKQLPIKEHRLVIIIIALVFELQVVALPVKVGWVHQ